MPNDEIELAKEEIRVTISICIAALSASMLVFSGETHYIQTVILGVPVLLSLLYIAISAITYEYPGSPRSDDDPGDIRQKIANYFISIRKDIYMCMASYLLFAVGVLLYNALLLRFVQPDSLAYTLLLALYLGVEVLVSLWYGKAHSSFKKSLLGFLAKRKKNKTE